MTLASESSTSATPAASGTSDVSRSRTVVELVAELSRRGIRLWVEGEQLRFKAPAGALTPELKTELVQRRAQMLEFLSDVRDAGDAGAEPAIEPVSRDGELPLSFAQERLWLIDRLDPGSASYNIFDAIRLQGRLRRLQVAISLREIFARHEVLRTSFVDDGGEPRLRTAASQSVPVPAVDLTGLAEPERVGECRRQMDREVHRGFDLARGPLFRGFLFRFAPRDHVMLFNMHHIVSDGWSTGVLVSELAALHGSLVEGVPAPLPPLPIQYADFAAWQRRRLTGDVLERQMSYWRETLAGLPDGLELPTDRPRPPVKTSRGRTDRFSLSAELSSGVRRLARQTAMTPYVVLMAAFQALLHRLTGEVDVVVGSPTASRNRREIEGLIGFFVNTLVLRTDVSGDPTFGELLDRVRRVSVEAQENQDVPFERLVEELAPRRDLSKTPLFQVMFVFQNAPEAAMQAEGLSLERWPLESATTKLDLTISVTDSEPAMTAETEYSTDLFDPTTVDRLVEAWQRLLASAVEQPLRRLSELEILTPQERHRVLYGVNDRPAVPGTETPVHRLIEGWARRAPDSVALVMNGSCLTYGEMVRRAHRLARELRRRGVGPDVPVGVFLERSVQKVVSFLGVMAAGGIYVPLDPSYPEERLAFMLTEPGSSILLTRRSLQARLAGVGVETLSMEDLDSRTESSEDSMEPLPEVPPEAGVYVIYTSGSTGRPKGVVNLHRSLSRFVRGYADVAGHGPGERLLTLLSFAFDASVGGVFPILAHGGTLVLHPKPEELSGRELTGLLEREQVTFLDVPVNFWNHWVEELDADAARGIVPALRWVVSGGEPVYRDRLRAWDRHTLGEVAFQGAYGPTEATVAATLDRTVAGEAIPPGLSRLPIGRPLPGVRLHLLDACFEPMPGGATGEVFLGGNVTRGYLKEPRSTAERFVPDPWGSPGDRLYRTGDFARLLSDGRVQFHERRDSQVKIRGFRIEPAEVEAALGTHPDVFVCAVAPHAVAGERQLVAYVVGRTEVPPEVAELRSFLSNTLPPYMVPARFVFLDALPTNPASGKVDYQALPKPEETEPSDRPYAAPRTTTEDLVARLWAEVLEVDRVGAHDNFFELGGHSLLATRVMSRLGQSLDRDLPLRELFEAPTVEALAGRVETLLETGGGRTLPPLERVDATGGVPLSPSQERFWLFEQLHPGTATYNTYRAGHVWGPLLFAAAQDVDNTLLRRHEALRTRFAAGEDGAIQIVEPHRRRALPLVDLSRLSAVDRESEAFDLAMEDARAPISLDEAPLTRTRLLRLGPEEHVFLLSIHHIAYDLWSGNILLEEIEEAYLAAVAGRADELTDPPVQYPDFAVWQRRWLTDEVVDEQVAYWRNRLARVLDDPMELPTDRPRPVDPSHRGDSIYPRVPEDPTRELWRLAGRRGASQYMAVLAVLKAVLARYTGHRDVVVGTFMVHRNRPELERVVGYFDNTVVLATDVSGDPTFVELMDRVRETALGAYAHQHVPFETLMSSLQPLGGAQAAPPFRVAYIFELSYPAMERELAGLQVVPYNTHSGTAKFDLTVGYREAPDGGLIGEIELDTDLFDRTTIQRMSRHFGTLLASAAMHPERRLSELNWMTPAERWQVTGEWNDTAVELSDDTLLDPFDRQVEKTPDAPAVTFRDRTLSYRDLAERSRKLAAVLRARGVGPESVVGVLMERSLELVVALYGVVRTGAAYLPLDPGWPSERLAHVVGEARVPWILTQEHLEAPMEASAPTIHLDADLSGLDTPSGEGFADGPGPVSPEGLAYVIYTSGSTGRPKGVMNRHRAIVQRLRWMQRAFPLDASDAVVQKTPFGFDVSVWEFFWPLGTGARLVMAEPGRHGDPTYLARCIVDEGITAIHFVPSMLRAFLDGVEPEALVGVGRALRRVILSGEALPFDLEQEGLERLGTPLFNLYGPTEAAVDVSAWRCRTAPEPRPVPIGRPIDATRLHVVDRHLMPRPASLPGELLIGGVQLGRGYLDQPGRTAASFVPDPSGAPGHRLYRTGDLVRTLADGRIEFLGRLDHQVKVRGYRIELGEIEETLRAHPTVHDAAALALGEGDRRHLVAYVVATPGTDATDRDLTDHLSRRLPPYMVPGRIVRLEAFPLNASGKLDRRTLARIEPAADPPTAEKFVAPAGPVEELVAEIWAQVLEVEAVDACTSFVELGGHSLLATRVIARVRKAFGVDLTLADLFAEPTVTGLARRVEAARRAGEGPGLPPLEPTGEAGEDRPAPLSFAQERLWFVHQLEPGSAAYGMPYALDLEGRLVPAALAEAFGEVVRRHEILRTVFTLGDDSRAVQRAQPVRRQTLPRIDLTGLESQRRTLEAARLAEAEAARPWDLSQGPLLRTRVLTLDAERSVLLLSKHHIVSDGWSLDVLVRELGSLYGSSREGSPSPLAELPIQYADFARWQRSWLDGELLEQELGYWRERLAGVPRHLDLPTDRPRPQAPTGAGGACSRELSVGVSEGLRRLGRQRGTTPFMTFLAAFETLLYRLSGQRDFAVGTPVAGRQQSEVAGLIGFFVNTLALRSDLGGDPSFDELLDRVRHTVLGGLSHQDLPFERLVREIVQERDAGRMPLLQTMFLAQEETLASLRLPELEMRPFVSRGEEARPMELALSRADQMDLILYVTWFGAERTEVVLEYSADLFDGATVERLLGHYEALLAAALETPGRRVSDLPLVSPEERRQMLAWSRGPAATPEPVEPVLARFEAQVVRRPEAMAVAVDEGEPWTYGELDARADLLAGELRRRGVGPETRVAVLLSRGRDAVAAILAVWKAGGVYVPLDAASPDERLARVLDDAGARVLLTDGIAELEGLARAGAEVLRVDEIGADAGDGSDLPVSPVVDGAQAAYVLYTSGSTGRVKGVVVSHGCLAVHLAHGGDLLEVRQEDRVLAFASTAFDVSLEQILAPLTVGAAVRLRGDDLWEPERLADVVEAGEVTVVDLTPAYWKAFLEACAAREAPLSWNSLRRISVGGESLPPETVELWRRLGSPEVPLVNAYGPTEATITATVHAVAGSRPLPPRVPIGRALPGRRAHVLGPDGQPTPVGVPGELVLGGEGVARGYLDRPAQTAAVFVPDPFADEAGARLYRTGDRVRVLPDGNLEFLGRLDHQVKIRGFRLELGEVEAALAELPGLREAAVRVEEDDARGRSLTAYLVPGSVAGTPATPESLDVDRMHRELARQLPDYMMPSGVVVLESLPRTPSGKVDRPALAGLEAVRLTHQEPYVAPRNDLERELVEIWADLLDEAADAIGVHDDFFRRGGHSLMATQLVSRIRKRLDADLSLAEVFGRATVADLAEMIEVTRWAREEIQDGLVDSVEDVEVESEEFEEFEL